MAISIVTPTTITENPTTAGSANSVTGEANSVVGEYGAGFTAFNNGDWSTFIGTGSIQPDYAEVTATETHGAILHNTPVTDGMRIQSTFEFMADINLPFVYMPVVKDGGETTAIWLWNTIGNEMFLQSKVNGNVYTKYDIPLADLSVDDKVTIDVDIAVGYTSCQVDITIDRVGGSQDTFSQNVQFGASTLPCFASLGSYDYATNRILYSKIEKKVSYTVKQNGLEVATTVPHAFSSVIGDSWEVLASDDGGATKTSLGVEVLAGALVGKEIAFRSTSGLGLSTPVVISKDYKATLRLAMHSNVDTGSLISWIDMGAEYDLLNTKFKIEMLNSGDYLKEFEENLKGGQYETITPVLQNASGFFPLTPLYKSCMKSGDTPIDDYYELAIVNTPQPSQLNIGNDAVHYSLDCIPNGVDLVLAEPYTGCGKYTGWTLAGVQLPYMTSMPTPNLNISDKSTQLNGGAYNPRRYRRDVGEIVKVSLKLNEERTRELLSTFKSIRGSVFTVVTPLNYNYFAHLYPLNTSFQCILSSNVIELDFRGHKNITVSFSIQLQAVNS